jgi:AraC-like DNA-binding protein
MIYYGNNLNTIIRNSDYLSDKLGLPYGQLSKLFSELTGQTLEKYIILVKIERVKELLAYNEMTLSEISYQMGYSSVQYLSTQFKQVTGYSVSEYKALPIKQRTPLDELLNSN